MKTHRTYYPNGIEELDNLNIKFPIKYTPIINGVDLYIKSGRVYISDTDLLVSNYKLINALKIMRERTLYTDTTNIIIHLTISGLNGELDVLNTLNDQYAPINHFKVYIRRVLRPNGKRLLSEKLYRAFGHIWTINNDIRIVWSLPTEVGNVHELMLKSTVALYHNQIEGIRLHVDNDELDLNLTSEVELNILSIKGEVRKMGRKNYHNLLAKVIVDYNGDLHEIDLFNHIPLHYRRTLWSIRNMIKEGKVKLKFAVLPTIGKASDLNELVKQVTFI